MSSNKNKAQSALKPKNQSSPFGTLTNKGNSVNYNPTYMPGQQDVLNNASKNEADIVTNGLPQATQQYQGSVNNLVNNTNNLTAGNVVNPEMYQSQYNLLANPIMQQYGQNNYNLENDLNAKNLTGGSYDAYTHGLNQQNLNYALGNAANQAVSNGLNATNTYLGLQNQGATAAGNEASTLGNLASNYQGLSAGLQSQLMNPFQLYNSYQSTLNPLQQASSSLYAQTPSAFQNIMGQYGKSLDSVIPGLGGASGAFALGNSFGNPLASGQFQGNGSLWDSGMKLFGGSGGSGMAAKQLGAAAI